MAKVKSSIQVHKANSKDPAKLNKGSSLFIVSIVKVTIQSIFFYTIFNSGMFLKFCLLCNFVYVKFHCHYIFL